jgi:hypothetical protein
MDKTITIQNQYYVPNKNQLQETIIQQNHNHITTGHPGQFKTIEKITRNYWWPRLQKDIKDYIEGCETCQQVKSSCYLQKTPLFPHDVPS